MAVEEREPQTHTHAPTDTQEKRAELTLWRGCLRHRGKARATAARLQKLGVLLFTQARLDKLACLGPWQMVDDQANFGRCLAHVHATGLHVPLLILRNPRSQGRSMVLWLFALEFLLQQRCVPAVTFGTLWRLKLKFQFSLQVLGSFKFSDERRAALIILTAKL